MEITETEYSAFLFEQKKKLDEKNPASVLPTGRDIYGDQLNESADGEGAGYSI